MEAQAIRLCVACDTREAEANKRLCKNCRSTAMELDAINQETKQLVARTMMDIAQFFGVKPKSFSH